MDYQTILEKKRRNHKTSGFKIEQSELNPLLFDFQKFTVQRCLELGKAAIFADCGLGKTLMQLAWADEVATHTGLPVMVFAPLAVSEQTIGQGATFGIEVTRYTGADLFGPHVYITNYERMDAVNFDQLGGVVLDESSILKSQDGKTRTKLIKLCQGLTLS